MEWERRDYVRMTADSMDMRRIRVVPDIEIACGIQGSALLLDWRTMQHRTQRTRPEQHLGPAFEWLD